MNMKIKKTAYRIPISKSKVIMSSDIIRSLKQQTVTEIIEEACL